MKWLNEKVSLYNCNKDNIGRNDFTFQDILLTQFGVPHFINGNGYSDMNTICELRRLDKKSSDYNKQKNNLKSTLQGFTPAALLETRQKDKVVEINRTGIAQLDFDGKDNPKRDMNLLKNEVFKYPFIAFCGLSCSGDGFYALAAIAEPNKLREYAEQMFWAFRNYGIIIDTTKGRNVHDLRYVSYDANMLIREDPEPLKINNYFKEKEAAQEQAQKRDVQIPANPNLIVESWLDKLRSCQQGNRMNTIRAVASALGSKQNNRLKEFILEEIKSNKIFEDERDSFIKAANVCFEWGWKNPLRKDLEVRV